MITQNEMFRFVDIRKRLFTMIDRALQEDSHHKSYEGAMSIHFPNRFEDYEGHIGIELSCYVLGPGGRHHKWEGKTLGEALDKMEKDMDQWANEEQHNL